MPLIITTINYNTVRNEIQGNENFINPARLMTDLYRIIQTAFDQNLITAPHRDFLREIANQIVTQRDFLHQSELKFVTICIATVGSSYVSSQSLINSLVEQFLLPPNDIGNMVITGILPIVDTYIHATTLDYIQRCLNAWSVYNQMLPYMITAIRNNFLLILEEMSRRNEN